MNDDNDIQMAAAMEAMDTMETATAFNDESEIWSGRPSQWVNLGTYVFWGVMTLAFLVFNLIWKDLILEGYGEEVSTVINYVIWGGVGLGLLNILLAYLTVYYEHTTITSNKIKEAKGITSIFRRELLCEISDISDFKSPPAGLLGLLGLSTLVIETNDNDQPIIKIRAIRDREELITLLLPIWRKLKIERKGYFGDR